MDNEEILRNTVGLLREIRHLKSEVIKLNEHIRESGIETRLNGSKKYINYQLDNSNITSFSTCETPQPSSRIDSEFKSAVQVGFTSDDKHILTITMNTMANMLNDALIDIRAARNSFDAISRDPDMRNEWLDWREKQRTR